MVKLELSEEYRHFNTLIWQTPSWGLAVAAGVIVAANQIGKDNTSWFVPVNYVQASVLSFGFFLLIALTIALYRYRAFQAAAAPYPIPAPPFRRKPSANLFLQGSLCLTSGGLGGLAVSQAFSAGCLIPIGLAGGVVAWVAAEGGNSLVVKEINRARGSS